MFSLQASSDEMLLLALLSHTGWCCSHSAQPPAAHCLSMAFLWIRAGETHGRG